MQQPAREAKGTTILGLQMNGAATLQLRAATSQRPFQRWMRIQTILGVICHPNNYHSVSHK